jgi:hypothetical protein
MEYSYEGFGGPGDCVHKMFIYRFIPNLVSLYLLYGRGRIVYSGTRILPVKERANDYKSM